MTTFCLHVALISWVTSKADHPETSPTLNVHGSLSVVTHAPFHMPMLIEACLAGWPNARVRRGGHVS